MTAAAAARLLDLTRLTSRVGRGPWTGIDRVEMAYLERFLRERVPFFALVRTSLGHVVLNREGAAALASRLRGETPWGRPDWLAGLHLRQSVARRSVMSDLRRLAWQQSRHSGLGRMLERHLPPGTVCFNVGHSNLEPAVFAGLARVPGSRAVVFLHDTIPLDFPQFTRKGTPEAFARRLALIAERADLVICNSEATRRDLERHLAPKGRVPRAIVAHLGADLPGQSRGTAAPLPAVIDPQRPWFLVLGTIEPRKNHTLLLDVWEILSARLPDTEVPQLVIAGQRGWNNASVFNRLDCSPLRGRHLHELPGLSDAQVATLMEGAAGVLFPSHAEGFGLPAVEAAAFGTPLICSELPVFREVLGDYPVYAEASDRYLWVEKIQELARQTRAGGGRAAARAELPDWEAHFRTVLSAT